jgi:S1-C subfamily serine protease
VQRLLTPLRGLVRPGNSGGPLVDPGGTVLTTVFAGTVGAHERGGYGVANRTVAGLLETGISRASSGVRVSTGPCTAG